MNGNENSPARAYPRAKARGFTALAYFGEFSEQKFSTLKGGALYPAKFLLQNYFCNAFSIFGRLQQLRTFFGSNQPRRAIITANG